MIHLTEPEWSSENASEFRTFLRTPTGQRLLANISYARPGFMPSSAHPHKSFAQGREIHGYEQAIRKLLSLIEAEDKPLSDTAKSDVHYPDLDDDSQWPSEIPA